MANLQFAISQNNDCDGSQPICTTTTQFFPSGNNGIGIDDQNTGCATETASSWFYFVVTTGGTLAFVIDPANNSTDYDWALYSGGTSPAVPLTDCDGLDELGPPIRCNFSSTTGNTGLSTTASNPSEPASGPSFSTTLTVSAGQVYYIMIDNYSADGYPFYFSANTGNTAVLDCSIITPPTSPCTCTGPSCNNAYHTTEAAATSENSTITSGADCTIFSPIIPVETDGSTDMTFCADYTIPAGTTQVAFITGGQYKLVSGGTCAGTILNRSVYASGSCGSALSSTGSVTAGGNPIYAVTPGATYVFCQTIRLAGPDCLQYNSSCINVFSVPTPPANDQCAGAVAITCASSTVGTTINATTTNDATVSCNGETVDAPGVWYTFTSATAQSVTIDTDNATTNFDTKIHVYTATGCGGPFTCVAGDDDAGAGTTSLVSFAATVGTNYYVLVNGASGATGNFALDVACVAAPVNDICSGALNLTCGGTLSTQNNTSATSTEDGLVCGTTVGATSRGMWYKFVGDGKIATITTTSLTGSEISVWTGSDCSSLTCLSGTLGTTHTFTAEAGTTYYILASTNAGGASTAFSIGLACATPAYNVGGGTAGGGTAFCNNNSASGTSSALPTNIMVVTALTGTLRDPGGTGNYPNSFRGGTGPYYPIGTTIICPNGSDGGSTTLTFNSFSTESGYDYVYVYDGPNYNYPQTTIESPATTGSPYTGTPSVPFSITSTNSTGCLTVEFYSDGSSVSSGFEAVWTSTDNTGVDLVANDDCSNAIPVGIECPTVSGTNINATASCSDPTPNFFLAGTLENTVWYKFTATAADAGATTVTLSNITCPDFANSALPTFADRGLQMGIYNAGTSGTCPVSSLNAASATQVADAAALGVTTLTSTSFTTVAGNTYYIGIDGNAGSSCDFDITIDRYATNFAVNSATGGSYSYTCDAPPAQTADVALTLSGGRTAGYSVTVVPNSITVTNSGAVYTLNNIVDGTTWTATVTDGLCTQIISGTYDYNLTCNPCATYSKNEVDITPVTSTVCAGATVAMTTAVDAARSVPTIRTAALGGRKYGDGVGGTPPLNYVADYKKYIQLLPVASMNATTIGTGVSQAQINGMDFTINAKWNDMYIALKNTSCAGSVVIWNGVNNTAFGGGTDATTATGNTTLTFSSATGLFTPLSSVSSYSSVATTAAMNSAFAGCNPNGFYLEFNDETASVLQYSINNLLFSVVDKTTTAITPTTTLTNVAWVGSGAATGGVSGSHTNIGQLALSNSDKNATFTAPPCAGPGNCVYNYTVTGKDVNGCTVTGSSSITVTPASDNVADITLCEGAAATSFSSSEVCSGTISGSVSGTNTTTNTLVNGTPRTINLPVSGVPAGATITDVNVSVTIAHNYSSDVVLSIASPSATSVALTNGTAGGSNNLGNTSSTITTTSTGSVATYIFDEDVAGVVWPVTDPIPAGSYNPTGNLNTFDGTTSINGNWVLNASDDATGDDGVITGVTVSISYTTPVAVEWYTVASGGTPVQSGTTFNPINDAQVIASGAPYSSLTNTNTPGVYTFYTGCSGSVCREPVTYTIYAKPVITAGLTQALCSGIAASRTITLSTDLPGTETFSWPIPTMTAGITGGTAGSGSTITDILTNSGTTAGTATYLVTVTADAADGGCTNTANVVITVNPNPTITLSATNTSVCAGSTTATLPYTATTGSPDQYSLDFDATAEGQGFADLSNTSLPASPISITVPAAAAPGTYNATLSVRNSTTGCISSITNITVTVNPLPTITLGASPVICSGTTTADLLYTATTDSPNQYSIDFNAAANSAGLADVALTSLPVSPIAITVPSGIAPGTYSGTILVRNSTTSCSSSSVPFTVQVNATPSISSVTTACTGLLYDITVNATTASGTLEYSLDGGAYQPSNIFTGLASGSTHSVTVRTVGTTCTATQTGITRDCSCVAPPAVTITETSVDVCGTSVATFNYTVANGPANVIENGAGTLSTTVLANGTGTFTYTPALADIGSTITVTATIPDPDGIGACTLSTDNVAVVVKPVPTISVASTSNPTTCGGSNGSIGLTFTDVPDGTYPVNYTGGSGSSSVTISGGTGTISGLSAGSFSGFTITVNGCTNSAMGSTSLSDPSTPTITVGTITSPTTCGGTDGSVALSFTNVPNATYNVTYTGGSGSSTITVTGGTGTITGLAAGTYTNFQITANGCTSTPSGSAIVSNPTSPNAPTVGTITPPTCTVATGSVVLNGLPASGTWTINPGGTTGTGASTTISSLSPGTYNFTVTNSAGCTSSASANVVIPDQPATPSAPVAAVLTQPTCATSTGSVSLTSLPSSGTWTINPGAISGSGTSTTITGLATGSHSFTVTNSAGCTSPASNTIVINAQPATPVISSTPATCSGPTYSITVNATVSSGSLEYSIDGGSYQTSNVFSGLASGSTHSVTVRTVGTTCTSTVTGITLSCACASPPSVMITEATASTCNVAVATLNYTVANGPASLTHNGSGTLSTLTLANGTGTFTYTPSAGDLGNTITITATIPDPDGVGLCVVSTDFVVLSVVDCCSANHGTWQH